MFYAMIIRSLLKSSLDEHKMYAVELICNHVHKSKWQTDLEICTEQKVSKCTQAMITRSKLAHMEPCNECRVMRPLMPTSRHSAFLLAILGQRQESGRAWCDWLCTLWRWYCIRDSLDWTQSALCAYFVLLFLVVQRAITYTSQCRFLLEKAM